MKSNYSSNHLSLDIQSHLPPISPPCRSPLEGNIPAAGYNKFAEIIRKSTNGQLQCTMFCGGRKCKYESGTNWSDQDKAIPALYSHWITDDILAMARPNNEIIRQFKLIDLFKKQGIKTIINLQEPGEHAGCGPSLDPSRFTYDPKLFMDNEIYFYNFQWKDYSAVGESSLLDMVKVVTFALSQGKIAIHCHAGLGRTGVLIAGYLIYTYRCQAHNAIKFVRMRRPNSIQSRGQILSLFKFANHISPCFIVYKSVSSKQISVSLIDHLQRQRILLHGEELRSLRYIPKVVFIICEKLIKMSGKPSILTSDSDEYEASGTNFTRHYLSALPAMMQKAPLPVDLPIDINSPQHGMDFPLIKGMNLLEVDEYSKHDNVDRDSIDTFDPDYNLQYEIDNFPDDIEKETNLEMEEKLLIDSLADLAETEQPTPDVEYLNSETMSKHRPSFEVLQQSLLSFDRTAPPEVILTVLTNEPKSNLSSIIYNFQKAINNTPTGWEKLCEENDLEILTVLLWSWFENLDKPILSNEIIELIAENKDCIECFSSLDIETRFTLEYLTRFVMRLCRGEDDRRRLVTRLVAALTVRPTQSTADNTPKQKQPCPPLSSRNREAICSFIQNLIYHISANVWNDELIERIDNTRKVYYSK